MATHQYRSPSIIVWPATLSSSSCLAPSAVSVWKQQELHHSRSAAAPSSSSSSPSAKSSSVYQKQKLKQEKKMSSKKWSEEDHQMDGDEHHQIEYDSRMIKCSQNRPLLAGGGDHRVRGRRETRAENSGNNILGLFTNNHKPKTFNDHPTSDKSTLAVKNNRQSSPKQIPEVSQTSVQLKCTFCTADNYHHHDSSSQSTYSPDTSLTSTSTNTTSNSDDFCSLGSGNGSCCSCRCCCSTSEESEEEVAKRRRGKQAKVEVNTVVTISEPRCGTVNQQIIPPPPPPPPPSLSKMGLLKNSTSSSPPKSKKKKGITFQEGGPVVIYREASDSETEEEFFELSLKSELNSSNGEKLPPISSSSSSTVDFDEENDPERVKLRQLTEANTFFNSNYANFKLNEASSVGLGRQSKDAAGPIKFVIQDGYQQPLPPTKYKAAANLNLKKSHFEQEKNCDNKPAAVGVSKPPVVKPTSAPPPLPPTAASSKPNLTKPVIEAKKPVIVQCSSPSSSSLSSSPLKSSPTSTKNSSSPESSAVIPTIRIPRATINTDKLNRSPPPAFVNSSSNPLKQALQEKGAVSAKPEKPPKNIPISKPIEKPTKETSPPPPPPLLVESLPPPTSIIKPVDTTDSALPVPKPDLLQQQQQQSYNSVILLDENDGTILPLDTQKLPEELKSDVADVRLDHGQLYLLRNGKQGDGQPQQQQSSEKLPEKPVKPEKEESSNVEADCCLSDDCGCSSSDSGASGCSPSSASPTAQLLEDDRSTTSTSPSPTDSLDSAASSPDSYESASPELRTSPPPPSTATVSPPSSKTPSQLSSPTLPPPPAQLSSTGSDSPRNSTMISISYRRSSSNGSSGSNEPLPAKRNEMLAKLAMDLEQHRAAGESKKISGNLSTDSSTVSLQHQQSSVVNHNNNNNYIVNNNNRTTKALPGFADLEKPKNVPLSKRDQFLADCYGDDDDDELTNSKSRALFARKSDSTDDSSDSECDPLPDMIKSDEEDEDSDDNGSDSDDECSEKQRSAFGGRRLSKDSGATKSTSSTSSLGSKQSKENKSVSALLRNVVQGSNTKKYTKLMKKNISKTSKFIVNTSKQIGSETSEMVKKLKDKSGGGGDKHDNYYYPEEYQQVKESKTKSKWTFSPNAQQSETSIETEVTSFTKKKSNKFEPMYAFAKSAYKNIEEKMKTSGQMSSKSSTAVGQAELPIDPFGGSGGTSSSDLNSSDAPALLKIKRLDSSSIEPNYSEPNLLVLSNSRSKFAANKPTVQSESNLVKPPLPPRNYRDTPEEEITETAETPPPQAPLRRKKLAKKRDQIVGDSPSNIEMTIPPQRTETEVSEAVPEKPNGSISSLSMLKAAYESYYRVFSTSQSAIEIFTAVNLQNEQAKISSHNSSQLRFYRCAHRGEQFYLLSSKNLWTTVYDCGSDQHSAMTFQNEPCRYLPIGFSRLYDISTFCQTVLYPPNSSDNATAISTLSNRAHLVDSLLLQLFSTLATFEEACTANRCTGAQNCKLSIGDVNDCLVAVNEENCGDVILLLPTKELEEADSSDDSLSMMQSFCLQVFLLRLTSMISNEDGNSGERKSTQHYRALVRRNQSGITELRHLYLLAALDIFKVLPVSNKRNSNGAKMSAKTVEQTISAWFKEQNSEEMLLKQHFTEYSTGARSFAPQSVATYALVQFAADKQRNQLGAIELAQRELLLLEEEKT